MKKITANFILLCIAVLLIGCGDKQNTQIVATTKPVYQFTSYLCNETPIRVELLISENVSCLHDYTLQVSQMRKLESAELIVINGAGFENFLSDALPANANIIDSSANIELHCGSHDHHDDHSHENDPHIWLNIENGRKMTETICLELCQSYPQYADIFKDNLETLYAKFSTLESKAQTLTNLSSREMITFHDGFSYLAESFDLHIIKSIEEEAGSEASAQELIEIIHDVKSHNLSAIFTETSSGSSAATIIQAETGVGVYALDMALSERDYFEAMEHNIQTLKEALE